MTSSAFKSTPSKNRLLITAKNRLNLHHNNVRRADVFRAVATLLGREFPVTKDAGYQMLAAFCGTKPPRPTGKRKRFPKETGDSFLISYEWRKLRMEVIKERGRRCECCGATPADGKTIINIDHIKPRKLYPGLALEKSNLQVLCHECNHGKGNWDQTDWRPDAQPDEGPKPRLVKATA